MRLFSSNQSPIFASPPEAISLAQTIRLART
jgi:hypothetical protein